MPGYYNGAKQGKHRHITTTDKDSEESGAGQATDDKVPVESSQMLKKENWTEEVQRGKAQEQEDTREKDGKEYEVGEPNASRKGEGLSHSTVQKLLDKLVLLARERKDKGNDGKAEKSC